MIFAEKVEFQCSYQNKRETERERSIYKYSTNITDVFLKILSKVPYAKYIFHQIVNNRSRDSGLELLEMFVAIVDPTKSK